METIDQEILALLSKNGRMSFTDIGKLTGLSTSAAQQRVRRLEQRGFIDGYHASVNAEAINRSLTAFISVRPLDPRDDGELPLQVAGIPQITACYSVAGDASYLLQAQVGTTGELDTLLTELRSTAHVNTTTTVVLSTIFANRPLVHSPGGVG